MRTSLTQRGFRQLLRLGGEGVQTLTVSVSRNAALKGKSFAALLQINPMVDIPSELISDGREHARSETQRTDAPAIQQGDTLVDENGNAWGVWNRDDNPATFSTVFWLVKIVPGKDT